MSNLQAKDLANLQGVPVENRQEEILAYIREIQLNSSSTSRHSVLKRLFKVSNKPLVLAYSKTSSATSLHEETEDLANKNAFAGIFSRKKTPPSIRDGSLSFVNNHDQSISTENQAPQDTPLPIAKPTTNKWTISVYWNKLFHRQKSQLNGKVPGQETIARNEAEEKQELELQQEQNNPKPETQLVNDNKKLPPAARQEQPLPIDPEPERFQPRVAAEQKDAKPNLPASNKVIPQLPEKRSFRNLPGEQNLSLFECDRLPVAAESEDVESNHPTSDDADLPIAPKPERSKPKTPEKRSVRSLSVGRTLSKYNHLSVAAEPEDVKPNQPASNPAEPEDAEPKLPASNEVNLPIDMQPDRLKPMTPKKSFVRSLSGDKSLRLFERDRLSVAAESEDVESNHPTSEDSDLPIAPKPERLKPKPPEKRSVRSSSGRQILSPFERDPLFVGPDSENEETNRPTFDDADLPIVPKPDLLKPKKVSGERTLSEYDHLSVTAEPEDVKPNQPIERAEPVDAEVNLPPSNEVNLATSNEVTLPIDLQPEHLKPMTPKKGSDRSLPDEKKDVESNHPTSEDADLPFAPKPDRSKPKAPKRPTRNGSDEHTLSICDHLSVAAEPEDSVPNQSASNEINPNP